MPTHFRWLWYLVGLAGMGLMVVGLLAILGSARDLGILVPAVAVLVIAVVGGLLWFRRSLNAAVAAAPSRQRAAEAAGAAQAGDPAPPDAPESGARASGTGSEGAGISSSEALHASRPNPKPPNPGRTSRRSP